MIRPPGLRFAFVFSLIYVASRIYPMVRFSYPFEYSYIIWLVAASLLAFCLLLLFLRRIKTVGPAFVLLVVVLLLEVASITGLIRLSGPEGVAPLSEAIYIIGLVISAIGLIHPSTRIWISADAV